ncbi:ABC transporter ATP-binding protein [Bacillus pacificus]|uniref:ABC transporter ATP-binding protein n=1 Tax=Bacillus cereus group TaxID=86661 RepID=UPI0009374C29|nr:MULTISPECIES: ABC transporter ATP-binding protein [Bacillus cereus group]ASI78791.1 bacitracin ABC transporter ATP-binding protein [Bacillus cereus]MCC2485331.1 ABC transporter ATP-binding protein [Bacillus pacificus]MDA1609546.1 ABC transporter ATP-binding protein [Bacillus cereus group sp. TH208-1LC]MDA1663647.1 ABC transporter ATP-binding protein [Bacillus cereus group sp. TH153LC]MED1650802.1 ABC transporter ATP-binding protein [Bacillus pacificus]
MNSLIINTNNLTKTYKKNIVVDSLNMKVSQGEIYGFLGPNGAGKTTTIRMLLGLIRPTKGDVKIFDQDLKKDRLSILGKIGSLVETPTYYGHLSGYENLEAARRLLRIDNTDRVKEVLKIVQLEGAKDKKVKNYSLGMKQRLGIATALLNRPQLLILDEPTNGLDPAGIHEIRELIKEMPAKFGMTVLVSSHLLSEIELMATQVGIIQNGKMLFQDSIEILRKESEPKIKIKVDKPLEAASSLNHKGIEANFEEEEGTVYIQESSPSIAGEANKILVEAGFTVYRLEGMKKSLEDIFLDLTGKGQSL